MNTKWYKAN